MPDRQFTHAGRHAGTRTRRTAYITGMTPFRSLSPATLAAFTRRWTARLQHLHAHHPSPLWRPDTPVSPALRQTWEQFLPVRDYLRDLRHLALACLPSPSWLPAVLVPAVGQDTHAPERPLAYASLPDLWHTLPPALAGRVAYGAEEFVPLLCALADPPRFGTDFGRYPEQQDWLAAWRPAADSPTGSTTRLLDIGCGTGQGTLEAGATVARAASVPVLALGLTREPLEAWMATTRSLPHDAAREARYRNCVPPPAGPLGMTLVLQFLAADAVSLPVANATQDIVLANGLLGGPMLATAERLQIFLWEARRVLRPGGVLLAANCFHDGHLAPLELFTAVARRLGWRVDGTARQAVLTATARSHRLNPSGHGGAARMAAPGTPIP